MGEELDSRGQLIKYVLIGLGGIIGGIIILRLGSFSFVSGIIVGGIIGLIGLGLIASKKESSIVGVIALAAGICIVLSVIPIIGSLARALMVIGGWVLIISGIVAVVKFIMGMSGRV